MSGRGNIFANLESKFRDSSEREIVEIALKSTAEFLGAIDEISDMGKFSLMIFGAKLGVAGDGEMNSKEQMLIGEVFGRAFNSLDLVYSLIDTEIDEDTYEIVRKSVMIGNSFAIPYLFYILSFAYIDGVFEDEVAERIEHIFGMNLLVSFIDSMAEDDDYDDYDEQPSYTSPKRYESRPIQSQNESDNERLMAAVYEVLEDNGEPMKAVDIASVVDSSVQKVTAVCTKLVADGKLNKYVEKGISYFGIR